MPAVMMKMPEHARIRLRLLEGFHMSVSPVNQVTRAGGESTFRACIQMRVHFDEILELPDA